MGSDMNVRSDDIKSLLSQTKTIRRDPFSTNKLLSRRGSALKTSVLGESR